MDVQNHLVGSGMALGLLLNGGDGGEVDYVYAADYDADANFYGCIGCSGGDGGDGGCGLPEICLYSDGQMRSPVSLSANGGDGGVGGDGGCGGLVWISRGVSNIHNKGELLSNGGDGADGGYSSCRLCEICLLYSDGQRRGALSLIANGGNGVVTSNVGDGYCMGRLLRRQRRLCRC